MRPLVVLSLVIVAVAALLFAFLSLDDEPQSASPVAPVRTEAPERGSTPESVDRLPAVEREQATPKPSERTAATSTRTELEGVRPVYANGLSGTVRDPEGEPVAKVELTLLRGAAPGGMNDMARILGRSQGPDPDRRTATTDASGRYRFRNLEPGGYALVAVHPEFSRKEIPFLMIPYEGEAEQDLTLEEGLMVHGYVRDEKGAPIAQARIELAEQFALSTFAPDTLARSDVEVSTTLTNAEGYYRILNVTPSQGRSLTAAATGYGSQTRRGVNIAPKNGPHTFDFILAKGCALAGRVFAPDRSPIVGARVEVIGYQEPQSLKAGAVTDGKGTFRITDLVEGAYFLQVSAQGWGVEKRQRVEAPDENVEIEMTEQGSVLGRVIDPDGAPVTSFVATLQQYVPQNGAYGRALAEQKFESPEGAFSLPGVSAGTYVVRVQAGGFATSYSQDFEVEQGLATTDVLVRMGRGGRITGRIVDLSSGEPVAGAAVSTEDNNYMENALTRMFATSLQRRTTESLSRTNSEGVFELNVLMPETYQLHVKHPRFPDLIVRDVHVREGDETDVGRLGLTPGSSVRGTVYDAAGAPLAGAMVQLTATTPMQFHSLEAVSGTDGRYVIDNVPSGSFKLTATRPHNSNDPFRAILDIRNSQVLIDVVGGRDIPQDLYLGGDGS